MRNRDLQRMNRRIAREREDRKRLSEFSEAGPSFTPHSTGDGQEKNGRLRELDRLNKHDSPVPDRRTPGFPSTFGHLARTAEEQAETGNEARVRLLRPSTGRLAREAAEAPEPSDPEIVTPLVPWWLLIPILIGASWAAVELYLAIIP